jgi:hypothetical protein
LTSSSAAAGGNSKNKKNNRQHRFHDLTFDEIVKIRQEVEAQFSPKIERGIQNKGLLEAIAKQKGQTRNTITKSISQTFIQNVLALWRL